MRNYLITIGRHYLNNFKGLPALAWQGIFICLIHAFCLGAFYFFSTYFTENLHLTVAETGSILAYYGLGAILGGYLSGRMTVLFSPILIAGISLIIQSMCYFTITKIFSVLFLQINLLILGISAYGFITTIYLIVLNNCQNQVHLKAINLLSTVSNVGLGFSVLAIGFCSAIAFKAVFIIISGILLLISCYLLTQFIINYDTVSRVKSLPFRNKNNDNNNLIIEQNNGSITKQNDNLAFNLFIFFAIFFGGVIISQISSTYSLYIQAIFPQLGIKAFSILFSINTLFIILFEVQIGILMAAYNKVSMMGLGIFLLGLGMFVLALPINFSIAVLACIIYSTGEILFISNGQLLYYQQQKGGKGPGLGKFRSIYASSRALGPAMGCHLYYQTNPKILWWCCGVIGILFLVSSISYFKRFHPSTSFEY